MAEFYRKYYRIDMTLKSPLSIGSGENENTDKDVIVDGGGIPFIPATSLAGVIRNYIYKKYGRAAANQIFGYIPASKEENDKAKNKDPEYIERKSQIIVYDAMLNKADDTSYFITSRDMVALENKVAVDGAKFDMEAVEPGKCFTAYIELLTNEESCDTYVNEALAAMDAGLVRLGSKTTRGYGEVGLRVKTITFDDVDAWLEFDMMQDESWDSAAEEDMTQNKCGGYEITVGLHQKGGISIREYTTEPSTEEETMPDYITMGLYSQKDENGEQIPVIPGTSWAGAFRDRYKEFSDEAAAKELFGIVEQVRELNKDGKQDVRTEAKRSRITFSESQLFGGTYKLVIRNAIDRFTGATKNGALYTEKTYFNGKTELKITFMEEPEKYVIKRICACLADLHNGFMAVGGLTSVGRGLFEITSINGSDLSAEEQKPENIFASIVDRLKGDAENE